MKTEDSKAKRGSNLEQRLPWLNSRRLELLWQDAARCKTIDNFPLSLLIRVTTDKLSFFDQTSKENILASIKSMTHALPTLQSLLLQLQTSVSASKQTSVSTRKFSKMLTESNIEDFLAMKLETLLNDMDSTSLLVVWDLLTRRFDNVPVPERVVNRLCKETVSRSNEFTLDECQTLVKAMEIAQRRSPSLETPHSDLYALKDVFERRQVFLRGMLQGDLEMSDSTVQFPFSSTQKLAQEKQNLVGASSETSYSSSSEQIELEQPLSSSTIEIATDTIKETSESSQTIEPLQEKQLAKHGSLDRSESPEKFEVRPDMTLRELEHLWASVAQGKSLNGFPLSHLSELSESRIFDFEHESLRKILQSVEQIKSSLISPSFWSSCASSAPSSGLSHTVPEEKTIVTETSSVCTEDAELPTPPAPNNGFFKSLFNTFFGSPPSNTVPLSPSMPFSQSASSSSTSQMSDTTVLTDSSLKSLDSSLTSSTKFMSFRDLLIRRLEFFDLPLEQKIQVSLEESLGERTLPMKANVTSDSKKE